MGSEARARKLRQRARVSTNDAAEAVARAMLNGQPVDGNYAISIKPQDAQRLVQLADDLPEWTPFERSTGNRYAGGRTREQVIAELLERTDSTREEIEEYLGDLESEEIYLNSRYQVNVRRQEPNVPGTWPTLVHLSIKRLDKLPPGRERFRDFQRIKDELVGPECEGVEVYPAESRLVDTANQFHLWVFADPDFRIPWGFESRLVRYRDPLVGATQWPWNPADGEEPSS